jgi:hypothetical protein
MGRLVSQEGEEEWDRDGARRKAGWQGCRLASICEESS